MTLSITINATDPSDLRRKLADMLGTLGGGPVSTIGYNAGPGGPAPKTEKAKPVIVDEGNPGEAAPEPEGEQARAYDYATEIKPAVLKVSQKFGRDGVIKLLEPYGVANAQLIPDTKHGQLMAEIEAMLEQESL